MEKEGRIVQFIPQRCHGFQIKK